MNVQTAVEMLRRGAGILLADHAGLPVGLFAVIGEHGADPTLDVSATFPSLRGVNDDVVAQVRRLGRLLDRPLGAELYTRIEFTDLQNRQYRSQGLGTLLVNAYLACAAPLLTPGATTFGLFSTEEGIERRERFYAGFGFPWQCLQARFADLHQRPPNPRRRFALHVPGLPCWEPLTQQEVAERVRIFTPDRPQPGRIWAVPDYLQEVERRRFPFARWP